MLKIDEDAIRERARELAAQGVKEDEAELLRRARADIEREFRTRTRDAGEHPHRFAPPLEVEEALTPGMSRRRGGLWGPDSPKKGS